MRCELIIALRWTHLAVKKLDHGKDKLYETVLPNLHAVNGVPAQQGAHAARSDTMGRMRVMRH
jgi:hypothetical protein